MADETGQTPNQTPPALDATGQEQKTFSAEYVRELRDEAKGYRLQLQELKDWKNKFESDQRAAEEKRLVDQNEWKTLAEQRAAELEQLRANFQQEKIRSAVLAEAGKLSLVDAEAAFKLADLSAVKIGENGTVEGVAEALKALADSKPYLVGQQQSSQTPPPKPQSSPMNFANQPSYTPDDIANWTTEQINANWESVVLPVLQRQQNGEK